MYALLLVVIGAVLPVAEVFADLVASGGFEVSHRLFCLFGTLRLLSYHIEITFYVCSFSETQ